MRAMAVVVLLAALLWPAAAVEPVCCDEATDGVTPAECHVYCEWNGVNFSHWLFVAYLETGE